MKIRFSIFTALLALSLFAQDQPPAPQQDQPPAPQQGQGPRGERGNGEFFLHRMLNDRGLMKELGVSGETIVKIDEANKAVNDRLRVAKARIDELSAKQVELAGTILNTPGADPQPLMDIINEIGQLRIVTAQEVTRRMLILRDTLTPEQMKALKDRLDQQRKIRRDQMLKEGAAPGEQRGPRRIADRGEPEQRLQPAGEPKEQFFFKAGPANFNWRQNPPFPKND